MLAWWCQGSEWSEALFVPQAVSEQSGSLCPPSPLRAVFRFEIVERHAELIALELEEQILGRRSRLPLFSRRVPLNETCNKLGEAGLVDILCGDALEFAIGHVGQVVGTIGRDREDQQHCTLLPSKKLAEHRFRRGLEERRREAAATGRFGGAGHGESMAAVRTFADPARELGWNNQILPAAGALDLKGCWCAWVPV